MTRVTVCRRVCGNDLEWMEIYKPRCVRSPNPRTAVLVTQCQTVRLVIDRRQFHGL